MRLASRTTLMFSSASGAYCDEDVVQRVLRVDALVVDGRDDVAFLEAGLLPLDCPASPPAHPDRLARTRTP